MSNLGFDEELHLKHELVCNVQGHVFHFRDVFFSHFFNLNPIILSLMASNQSLPWNTGIINGWFVDFNKLINFFFFQEAFILRWCRVETQHASHFEVEGMIISPFIAL